MERDKLRGKLRFIPTRVGNTIVASGSAIPLTVHPHASGEHITRVPDFSSSFGSSPREWGTRFLFAS